MSVQWLVGMVWLACGYGLALPATTKTRRAVPEPKDQPGLDKVIDAYFDRDS